MECYNFVLNSFFRFRHAVVLSMTGKTKMAEDYEKNLKKNMRMSKYPDSKKRDSKTKQLPIDFGGTFCCQVTSRIKKGPICPLILRVLECPTF